MRLVSVNVRIFILAFYFKGQTRKLKIIFFQMHHLTYQMKMNGLVMKNAISFSYNFDMSRLKDIKENTRK